MWDSTYMMPELLDIARALIRHKVLDIGKQNCNAVPHISLAKPRAFLACKENLGNMKKKLVALEVLQDREDAE